MSDWTSIEAAISEATGRPFRVRSDAALGGGCINEAQRVEDGERHYFVKLNSAAGLAMFEAEAAGLRLIRDSDSVRVPQPVCAGADSGRSWLVLEFVEFGTAGPQTSARLGEQLAAMHRSDAPAFGWERDNTIGSTPQINTPNPDWVDFFAGCRLGFQLDLAQRNGAPGELIDGGHRLRESLAALFDGYRPQPSLLHGDLWGGNWAADSRGEPVIFDPAVYYGDREADLAMTELFGGFDERFYRSYANTWAIDPGYQTRKVLYNLYHVLNHFNLFGGGYARQALAMTDRLLADIA